MKGVFEGECNRSVALIISCTMPDPLACRRKRYSSHIMCTLCTSLCSCQLVRYKAVKLIIGGVAVRRCHAVQVCQSLVFDLAAGNCSYPCKGLILLNWGPRIASSCGLYLLAKEEKGMTG